MAWDVLLKAALERGSRSWKWLQCVDPQDELSGELNPNPKSLLSFRSSDVLVKTEINVLSVVQGSAVPGERRRAVCWVSLVLIYQAKR